MKIGERIRQARKNKGLTQEQLAILVNKSAQVISNWERGYTSTINYDDIAKLSDKLNITPEYLLGHINDREQDLIRESNTLGDRTREQETNYLVDKSNIKSPSTPSSNIHKPSLLVAEIESLSDESKKELEKYIQLLKIKEEIEKSKDETSSASVKNA